MKRTYSRKGAQRKLRNPSVFPERPPSPEPAVTQQPRKRQRIQVEVVSTKSLVHDGANASSASESESLTTGKATRPPFAGHRRATTPQPRKASSASGIAPNASVPPHTISHFQDIAKATAIAPRPSLSGAEILLSVPDNNAVASSSPSKSAKDLSNLFEFTSTTPQNATLPRLKPTSSGGIARRMLARSRTESTVSSGTSFESIEVVAGPSTPRRLTKTKSEGILDLTSASPSRQGSLTPSKSQNPEESSSPAPARPSLVQSNVRTYAGKSRSFLVALPAAQFGVGALSRQNSQSQTQSLDDDLLGNSQEDDLEITESYTDLRMRWGVDNSEDDPRPPSPVEVSPNKSRRKGKGKQIPTPPVALPNGMMNDLKSITELRSKGESRRFLDEMGYLFEGLAATSTIGVRRGSALEVVEKLCDVDFARRAKAADFFERAWDVLRAAGAGEGDKVLDTTLAFFATLVARDAGDLVELAEKSDFVAVLYKLLDALDRHNDPLCLISCNLSDPKLRKAGISKADKTLLSSLHRLVRKKSGLFDERDIISNGLLISQALTNLPSSSHTTSQFPSLLKNLSAELVPIQSRVLAFTSGLSLIPDPSSSSPLDIPSLLHVDHCLQLLDSYLLGRWSDDSANDPPVLYRSRLDGHRQEGFGQSLVALCIACDILSRDVQHHEEKPLALRVIESALRVLINLTHDDPPWSEAVLCAPSALLVVVRLIVYTQRQRVHASIKLEDGEAGADVEADAAHSLDRLCLALGLLTNLVQVSQQAKDLARDTLLDYNCAAKRVCTLECRCPSRTSLMECLVSVYIHYCKSDGELDPVVRGHMAVLFGLLMRDSAANARVLLHSLPGASRWEKLDVLVEHAREFTTFYVAFTEKVAAAVSQRSVEGEGDGEERLVGVDESVDRVLRDAKGESVARDVIKFLEELRDACSQD